jgi:hypothetical protein
MTFCMCPLAFGIAGFGMNAPPDAEAAPTDTTTTTGTARSNQRDTLVARWNRAFLI